MQKPPQGASTAPASLPAQPTTAIRNAILSCVHWLAGCTDKLHWLAAPAGCTGRLLWQAALAGCTGWLLWLAAQAGCSGWKISSERRLYKSYTNLCGTTVTSTEILYKFVQYNSNPIQICVVQLRNPIQICVVQLKSYANLCRTTQILYKFVWYN